MAGVGSGNVEVLSGMSRWKLGGQRSEVRDQRSRGREVRGLWSGGQKSEVTVKRSEVNVAGGKAEMGSETWRCR
jgi:hypothetical protein